LETSWDSPWVIAIHEAGHAVAAWALELELIRVTIAEGEPGASYNAEDSLRAAQATAAGPIAQCLFGLRGYRHKGWGNDKDQFRRFTIRKVTEDRLARQAESDDDIPPPPDLDAEFDAIDALRAEIIDRTKTLIRDHERHVRALANKLLKQVEISGAEAKAFLDAIER
jgi:hypothetical protein